jgi:hypothetical protein
MLLFQCVYFESDLYDLSSILNRKLILTETCGGLVLGHLAFQIAEVVEYIFLKLFILNIPLGITPPAASA